MPKRPHQDEAEWLTRLHRSLCTIYTFLASSKRKIIITFDVLQPMVERELGCAITRQDVAKIKTIIPDQIVYQYVDEHKLHLDIEEIGYEGGRDKLKQFLVFEYVHGKVRARKPDTIAKEVKTLVTRRIETFRYIFEEYQASKDKNDDWQVRLEKEMMKYVPVEMVYDDPMQLMMVTTNDLNQKKGFQMASFLTSLKSLPEYRDQIISEYDLPQRSARFGELDNPLPEVLETALIDSFGIQNLYFHQATAINELSKGNHVFVTTATSSGKSLIYQLPVLTELIRDPTSTAIYIFPTKALAQDQKQHLQALLARLPPEYGNIVVDTFDGDTERSLRPTIRQRANVIFTNPDTLHTTILRHHDTWRRFLSALRYVVVDELHYYNGIFGTHVSYIMRRLRRLCEKMYNDRKLLFISCSATVREPEALMRQMFGFEDDTKVSVVTEDGSPCGEKHYAIWNCRYLNEADGKKDRVHPVAEATTIMLELVTRGIRTIAFCTVRKTCELLMKSIREEAASNPGYGSEISNRIMSYRGGYSAEDRRKIEGEMFSGNLLGIVATNALELGIDIGGLDAVLVVGFPFSISSFRQQVGRAGRRNQDSLALLVCGGSAVDQFYVQNPRALVDTPDIEISLALDNLLLRDGELSCANAEMRLDPKCDYEYFGDISEYQVDGEHLPKMRVAAVEGYQMPLRGKQEIGFAVVDVTNDKSVVIEEIEESRVPFTLYEGGIFLHKGQTYIVLEFNPDGRFAKVQKVNVDWLTRQRDYTDVDPIETSVRRRLIFYENTLENANIYYGRIKITILVFGFFKVNSKGQIIDNVDIESSPSISYRSGFWINIPKKVLEVLTDKNLSLAGAIHGAEHAIISMLPTLTKVIPGEISTECKAPEKEFSHTQTSRMRPGRLIFYNSRVESSGVAQTGYRFAEELLANATERVDACRCEWGCPECIAIPNCKERNEVISKIGTRVILRSLVGRPIPADQIPMGPEPNLPQIVVDTVSVAAD